MSLSLSQTHARPAFPGTQEEKKKRDVSRSTKRCSSLPVLFSLLPSAQCPVPVPVPASRPVLDAAEREQIYHCFTGSQKKLRNSYECVSLPSIGHTKQKGKKRPQSKRIQCDVKVKCTRY